ncbi:MAG: methionine--tRNA ligase [Alphaproteobacteria bacterium]|nr:methionine--tRNA ligase [Alphaproteobacteria bacterium]
MTAQKSYYITTPIYYVNDKPHLGHAYTTIACDVLARFKRLDGYDVHFLTGTDEHGQKVAQAAEAKGIPPQQFTDEVSQNFRDLVPILNFSNDDFIRTTQDRHKAACQALWKKLVETDNIYLSKYSGWYAVRDEAYYGEDELKDGPGGKKIAPSGAECEWVEEESYFFRLSAWQDKLLEHFEKNPDFILPESRRNEVISFVKGGLRDLSVSRTRMNWGVPVPDAPDHVMYVWIDALTNYITAVGYPNEDDEQFKKFWPADLHMVGKDILRFHTVYWPAFLWAAGLEAPKRVFAHGWWTIEGEKMSKSIGNVIAPADLVERYGVESARYFLLREVPFGNDGDFSHEQAVQRINSELANGLGNLVQRTLSQIHKNCEEKIPQPGEFTDDDKKLLKMAQEDLLPAMRNELDRQRFHKALEAIVQVVYDANAYIDVQAPWALKKTDVARMNTVLYVLAETIRCIGLAMQPVTPTAAAKILDQLVVPQDQRTFMSMDAASALKAGDTIPKPEGVFPRIMDEEKKEAVG